MKQATLLLLALAACTRGPSFEELRDRGYGHLQQGELAAAEACAVEGRRGAEKRRDPAWDRVFRVLHAEVLVEQRRNAEAIALLESTPKNTGPPDEVDVRALMTLGRARCRNRGDTDGVRMAEAELEEAGRLAASLGSVTLAAEVVRLRGACDFLQDDFQEAEAHFSDALVMARQAKQPFLEAKALGSIGLLRIKTGRYDDATDKLNQALSLSSALKVDLDRVKHLTNLGWCYYLLGDYDRAKSFHEQAEALAEAKGYKAERQISLQNIGGVYYRLGDSKKAADNFQRSLTIAREQGEKWRIADLLSNLGVVALDEGRYDEAAASVREALRINEEMEDAGGVQYSLAAEGLIWAAGGDATKAEARYREVMASPDADPALRWLTGAALADLLIRAQRPVEAEVEFRKAFDLMEQSYTEVREAEHRISFFSSFDEFYDGYVDFLVGSGRSRQALEVADQSRARLLREMLGAGSEGPTVDPGLFQEAARSQQAVILVYWLAPSRSFLWVVTPQRLQLHELPGEREIREHVEAHQALVLRSRDPLREATDEAAWLYRTLVGPAAGSVPPGSRVVFVPDGPLHQLNPETLVVSSPRPHYWIEDVTLLTAPSVSVLAGSGAQPGSRRARAKPDPEPWSILLIGDALAAGEEFDRLTGAGEEITRIADLFKPEQRTVYSGPQAVPSAYSDAKPGRFTFIHFAAHAQANREVPLDSAVILSAEGDSPKLYAREILGIPLRARLVTLSACRSAGSRSYAGEGLVGLTWAFLSAGAGNVIAGLWNVEDRSTSELMAGVYYSLSQGQRPADALRQAKLRLLGSATANRKPYYWAPFMIYTRGPGPSRRSVGSS